MSDYPILHLYAQECWHEPAVILGNRQGLEQLRDALNAALEKGSASLETMTGDGEGYDLLVAAVTEEDMRLLPMPYIGEIAIDTRTEAIFRLHSLITKLYEAHIIPNKEETHDGPADQSPIQ